MERTGTWQFGAHTYTDSRTRRRGSNPRTGETDLRSACRIKWRIRTGVFAADLRSEEEERPMWCADGSGDTGAWSSRQTGYESDGPDLADTSMSPEREKGRNGKNRYKQSAES